jgi:hypothetical protein
MPPAIRLLVCESVVNLLDEPAAICALDEA